MAFMRRLAAVFAVLLSLAGICAEGRAKCVTPRQGNGIGKIKDWKLYVR